MVKEVVAEINGELVEFAVYMRGYVTASLKLKNVWLQCPDCLEVKPVAAFGLRSYGYSHWRNQPRCVDCKGALDG
jgi:hypothetical protein